MIELYPILYDDNQISSIIKQMIRIRQTDLDDWNNLPSRFVQGRGLLTSRDAPASASDVLSTDEEGDICNDATYEYKLLNISGTFLWDRRVLDTSW